MPVLKRLDRRDLLSAGVGLLGNALAARCALAAPSVSAEPRDELRRLIEDRVRAMVTRFELSEGLAYSEQEKSEIIRQLADEFERVIRTKPPKERIDGQ